MSGNSKPHELLEYLRLQRKERAVKKLFKQLETTRGRQHSVNKWLIKNPMRTEHAVIMLENGEVDKLGMYAIFKSEDITVTQVYPFSFLFKAKSENGNILYVVSDMDAVAAEGLAETFQESLFTNGILKEKLNAYPIRIHDDRLTDVSIECILRCALESAFVTEVFDYHDEGGESSNG